MLPNVFVVGSQKCGTTWLYDYLDSRGDVCLPEGVKETFYFDKYFHKGSDWYQSHFSKCLAKPEQLVVEVAPSYFSNKSVQKRISEYVPDAKIVVMVRDPIARSWSHYLHLKRYGYTNKSLIEAVQDFPEIIEASLYEKHIKSWKKLFGEKSVLVFSFDDLAGDSIAFTNQFCDTLGITRMDKLDTVTRKSNESAVSKNYYLAKVVNMIADYFRQHKMYIVVNFFKRIGLKKFIFGDGSACKEKQIMSSAEEQWLLATINRS